MVTSMQMKHLNTGNFICDLASLDWQLILHCYANNNDIGSNWTHVLACIIEMHDLLRERRVSDRLDFWLTPNLMQLTKTRDKLKTSAVKAKSEILMQAYRKLEIKLTD